MKLLINVKLDIFYKLKYKQLFKFTMESVKNEIILEKNWCHPTSWKKADELIKNYGKQSEEDADLVNNFFEQNIKEKNIDKDSFKTIESNKILEKFPNMPYELRCIYKVIGNPFVEYYFGRWALRSLKHVEERFNLMKEANNSRIIDFAINYCGMGHCVVCSYDSKDGRIFYRRDGGSNGWDRKYNWEFISKYIPEDDKKHNFMTWIQDIKNPDTFLNEPWKYLEDPKIVNP